MIDIVVDSNVLSHAQNPEADYFDDSRVLLEKLTAATTLLCMDGRFAVNGGNSSLIGQEYLQNVGFGGPAFAFLLSLMQNDRIKAVPVKVPYHVKKRVDLTVPNNARDRTFVRVAFNSVEKALVSHDYHDFTPDVRKTLRGQLGVVIEEAGEIHPRLTGNGAGSMDNSDA
jgi:hypothetical protein